MHILDLLCQFWVLYILQCFTQHYLEPPYLEDVKTDKDEIKRRLNNAIPTNSQQSNRLIGNYASSTQIYIRLFLNILCFKACFLIN